VLINRDPLVAATAQVTLDGCAEFHSYRVFRFVSGADGFISKPAGAADGKRISEILPPYSLTVLDLVTQ